MEQTVVRTNRTNRVFNALEGLYLRNRVSKLGNAILWHTVHGDVSTDCATASVDESGFVARLDGVINSEGADLSGKVHVQHRPRRRPLIQINAYTSGDVSGFSAPQFTSPPLTSDQSEVVTEHLAVVKELTRRFTDMKPTSVTHTIY